MNEKTSNETKGEYTGKTPSRQGEYARIAKLLPHAIEVLEELLDHPNCNVRLGAVNKVLDKCLPDLRATEITGEDGGPIRVQLINDYLSTFDGNVSSSTGGPTGQVTIQSSSMAPKSKENNDGTGESGSGSPQPAP